jgi:hypothetical protein
VGLVVFYGKGLGGGFVAVFAFDGKLTFVIEVES